MKEHKILYFTRIMFDTKESTTHFEKIIKGTLEDDFGIFSFCFFLLFKRGT